MDVSLENMDKSPINQNNIEFCVGILIFNMLMLGINMAPIIIKDKISRVYYRIFVSPIKPQNYTLQNLMRFFCCTYYSNNHTTYIYSSHIKYKYSQLKKHIFNVFNFWSICCCL